MKLNSFITLLTITAMTTGCSVLRNNQTKSPKPTVPATKVETVDVTPIDNIVKNFEGEWSIVEVEGEGIVVNGENHPKLSFEPTESQTGVISVIGFNGCNYINGMWDIKGSKITRAGEFLTSLKACDNAPYEFAINRALNDATTYQFTDPSNVSLMTNTGRTVMKLRKHNLAFLNGAWRVTAIEGNDISAKIKIVIDVDQKQVHGNAGCNLLNGEITINLDKGNGIEFKNLATSRMTCPDIATEQAFLLALENVDTAVKGPNADTAYLKNSAGQVIISLKRLAPDEIADED